MHFTGLEFNELSGRPNDQSSDAEDHALRSLHMRRLVQETAPTAMPSGPASIPKVIVQFWHDSGAIPSDVGECLDSWTPLANQGFKRVLFDDRSARRFIARRLDATHVAAFDRCHHPAMRCDYFRLCYIHTVGGFYVDADEVYQGGDCRALFRDNRLKIQPMCYDTLTGAMVSPDVFIERRAHSPGWIFYVNNNPLIAPASHPVVRLALDRSTRILLGNGGGRADIQSTTGPGNLTASLIKHHIQSGQEGQARDFQLLTDWDAMSISRWPLSYRNDERNWRLWSADG